MEEARSLFYEVTQLKETDYFLPAHYYYGFICYFFREYEQALRSFEIAVKDNEYNRVIPYYISEILYLQGKKDDALKYGDSVLIADQNLHYKQELNLLIGQLYFEKNNYQKAMPLLEDYAANNNVVSKTILYELSYCYFQSNQIAKAIKGFKEQEEKKAKKKDKE
jgi:tetratricopeptide (TPR) repeat protein